MTDADRPGTVRVGARLGGPLFDVTDPVPFLLLFDPFGTQADLGEVPSESTVAADLVHRWT